MKKLIKIILSLVIFLSFSTITMAADIDTPVDPIDPDEYFAVNVNSYGTGYVYLSDGSQFDIEFHFSGYYRKSSSTSPAPYLYNISASINSYELYVGTGTPVITNTNYYVYNGQIGCTVTISNGIGSGSVGVLVCSYH